MIIVYYWINLILKINKYVYMILRQSTPKYLSFTIMSLKHIVKSVN
jgi:hypothetical protein